MVNNFEVVELSRGEIATVEFNLGNREVGTKMLSLFYFPDVFVSQQLQNVIEMEEIFTEYCPCCDDSRVISADEYMFNLGTPRVSCMKIHENQNLMGWIEEELQSEC